MSGRLSLRSLRGKALAFVLAVSASFVALSYGLQRAIVQPEFAAIESREADANLARAVGALAADADFLAKSARDYAAWDDTYAFTETRSPVYVEANLIPETLSNLGVDALVIASARGEVLWGMRCCAEPGELVEDAPLMAALTARAGGLVDHDSPKSRRHGVLLTHAGMLLVGSAAITDSEQQAPVRGSVIFARFLDAAEIAALGERTVVALAATPMSAVAHMDRAALAHLAASGDRWHDTSDAGVLRGYTLVSDVTGAPALLVRIDLPRATSRRAAAAARLTAVIGAAGALVMLAGMWWVMERFLVRPLEHVTAHALRVGAEGDLGSRLNLAARDEIGVLAREFDAMVERLERSRAQLVEVARKAGRAEVASAVLHDVGNVLNSVTVAANLATETIARSELPSLRQLTDLLRRNEQQLAAFLVSDPRGQELLPFLSELTSQLEGEQRQVESELKTLGVSVDHVRALVRAQNRHSHAPPLLERVDPALVLEQALTLCADSLQRQDVRLARRITSGEPVLLDRHRCLQVLTNLLSNARNALDASGRRNGAIRVAVDRARDEAGEWVAFVVSDDGVGIDPENLERIFALGYSTHAEGHGIGLHNAANLAREMGGTLRAASDGLGRGASFTLRVPVARGDAS